MVPAILAFIVTELEYRQTAAPSLKEWQLKAQQGDPAAQHEIAKSYWHGGEGVVQNKREAVAWFYRAAEQGHAQAQYALGYAFLHGEGVTSDASKAAAWWNEAAAQGHAKAQADLGELYANGYGVEKNMETFWHWIKLAAEQKEPKALNHAAYTYWEGELVAQDKNKALRLYREAAERGSEGGQYGLGYTNFEEKNYREAYIWFYISAENGFHHSAGMLPVVAAFLSESEIKSAKSDAKSILRKIANR